jgi:hypothetical protein
MVVYRGYEIAILRNVPKNRSEPMEEWDLLSDEDFGESFIPKKIIEASGAQEKDYSFVDHEQRSPSPPRPDLYLYSVQIFPPPPSVLSRDYFNLIFFPAIQKVLSHSRPLAPDRGWRSETEFHTEFNTALRDRNCCLNGIVIARKQTEEEAKELVEKLLAIQVSLLTFYCRPLPLALGPCLDGQEWRTGPPFLEAPSSQSTQRSRHDGHRASPHDQSWGDCCLFL